ncbi:hypothetical protein ACU8MG_25305 (plasmid) [Rhizobium leguminosarum]
MLIGGLTDVTQFRELDPSSREAALMAALDEFRTNPVIDKEVQNNTVIMGELAKAVNRSLNPTREVPQDFKVRDI